MSSEMQKGVDQVSIGEIAGAVFLDVLSLRCL